MLIGRGKRNYNNIKTQNYLFTRMIWDVNWRRWLHSEKRTWWTTGAWRHILKIWSNQALGNLEFPFFLRNSGISTMLPSVKEVAGRLLMSRLFPLPGCDPLISHNEKNISWDEKMEAAQWWYASVQNFKLRIYLQRMLVCFILTFETSCDQSYAHLNIKHHEP